MRRVPLVHAIKICRSQQPSFLNLCRTFTSLNHFSNLPFNSSQSTPAYPHRSFAISNKMATTGSSMEASQLNLKSSKGSSEALSRRSSTTEESESQTKNALDVLKHDHVLIRELYQRARAARDSEEKQRWANEFIRSVSVHDGIELTVLYEAVEKYLQNGKVIADHAREDHAKVRANLYELSQKKMDDSSFPLLLETIMKELETHIDDEENNFVPKLQQTVGEEKMRDIGRSLESHRKLAPTRPHPAAPDKGLGVKAASMMSAPTDRAMDAMAKDFPKSESSKR